jgi:hypothetical protein
MAATPRMPGRVNDRYAQTAPDAAELTKLLNDFLAGASRNDAAIHERFWADDLIYTRSAGRRVNKAEVMHDVRTAPAPKPTIPKPSTLPKTFAFNSTATRRSSHFVWSRPRKGGAKHVANLLNSGTFVKRDGKWQVVNWQSTRMPRTEAESKSEVTVADAAFHRQYCPATSTNSRRYGSNVRLDTRLVQTTRQQLLDDLRAGKVKYGKPDPAKVSISVYGDTAIVRGEGLPRTPLTR